MKKGLGKEWCAVFAITLETVKVENHSATKFVGQLQEHLLVALNFLLSFKSLESHASDLNKPKLIPPRFTYLST